MEKKSIVSELKSESETQRRVALIDADFIPFYVCHNKKGDDGIPIEKTFEECKALCDDFIVNILKVTNATHYIMCFTVGKCFRYRINPQYKANRKYDQVIPFLKETKEYLINAYNGYYNDNYEADDIVATLKSYFGPEAFLVSPDKDILMLDGQHFNPRLMEWVVSLDGDNLFWKSMIIGDSADNIKGIPKKGEKYAQKALSPYPGNLKIVVLDEYCKHFGEYYGIIEFHKNYVCLKIVEDAIIVIPKLQEVKAKKEETLDEIDINDSKRTDNENKG